MPLTLVPARHASLAACDPSDVLFVTWDGADQNYLDALFLPIFAGVGSRGPRFDVLQFTWASSERISAAAQAAEALGIGYMRHPVWRRPQGPATAGMIALGGVAVVRAARRFGSDVLMPRALIPAAMCLVAQKLQPKLRIVFDADGLVADERVDFVGWRTTGLPYRILRAAESQCVRRASGVITRTHACKRILLHRAGPDVDADKIFVVPNGKDEAVFTPGTAAERKQTRAQYDVPAKAPWIVYAGSLGPQYHPAEMVRFFERVYAQRPDARMLVLTGQAPVMHEVLRESACADAVRVDRVAACDVPAIVAAADLGLGFRTASYSQQAVSPIKVAEYLLCGTPALATTGVGDIDTQLTPEIGRVVHDVSDANIDAAADWFVQTVLCDRAGFRRRCRRFGVETFGMQPCVDRYISALRYRESI